MTIRDFLGVQSVAETLMLVAYRVHCEQQAKWVSCHYLVADPIKRRITLMDHTQEEVEAEGVLDAMGGRTCQCLEKAFRLRQFTCPYLSHKLWATIIGKDHPDAYPSRPVEHGTSLSLREDDTGYRE